MAGMNRKRSSGIAVALAVAGVYAYFLLFAQFAFLELLQAKVSDQGLKGVLAMMALGGVVSGFVVSRSGKAGRGAFITAMVGCVVVARCSRLTDSTILFALLSLVMGVSLGTATVCLASLIGTNLEPKRGCLWVGLGTGLAYGFCNIPLIFTAPPHLQASISAALATLAALGGARIENNREETSGAKSIPWRAILIFGALVWMDSAAFYVIQHAPELKDGTWGAERLWRNAAVHFSVAILAGFWLSKGGWKSLCVTAWGLLALAGWWVNDNASREWAGWLYPAGVSLYSTALVAWPGLLAGRTETFGKSIASRAAWLFGIAGWIGSANGIGMVESLQRVPGLFLILAGLVAIGGTALKAFSWRTVLVVLFIGSLASLGWRKPALAEDSVSRGRQVYLSEGCIHCHSRYVRPGSPDELVWGNAADPTLIAEEKPVLIGNRRQGPDLLHVGGRRSESWLREHFLDPRQLSPDSPMPAYGHLFRDGRGEDLIAFLRQNVTEEVAEVQVRAANWKPASIPQADPRHGQDLFFKSCTACHGVEGRGDGALSKSMKSQPRDLLAGPFSWTLERSDEPQLSTMMRVLKFGIPGTDMPGHETWSDQELADLAAWVLELRRKR
jgi:cytochrome c oxidase cbb3-type subunit 2